MVFRGNSQFIRDDVDIARNIVEFVHFMPAGTIRVALAMLQKRPILKRRVIWLLKPRW
jgi:hypothetical protein